MTWGPELRVDILDLFVEAQRSGRRRRQKFEVPVSVEQLNGGLFPAQLDLLMALTATSRVNHAAKKVGLSTQGKIAAMRALAQRGLVRVWKQPFRGKQVAWHARIEERGWLLLLGRKRLPKKRVKPVDRRAVVWDGDRQQVEKLRRIGWF